MMLDVTMENFDRTLDEHPIVILDFWAAWCGPCRAFAPVFEAAAARHPDVGFGKVDTEAAPDLAQAFQVRSIPTVMVFLRGELVFEQAGTLPGPVIDGMIAELKALPTPAP